MNYILFDKNYNLLKVETVNRNNYIIINNYNQYYFLLSILSKINIINNDSSNAEKFKHVFSEIKNELIRLNLLLNKAYYPNSIIFIDNDDLIVENYFLNEKIDTYDYNIFQLNNKIQISGSCSYYSIFMSLYYISYVCQQISKIPISSNDSSIIHDIKINFKEDYNILFYNLKKSVENYMLSYIKKIFNNPYKSIYYYNDIISGHKFDEIYNESLIISLLNTFPDYWKNHLQNRDDK
jgi:hypothetical protein